MDFGYGGNVNGSGDEQEPSSNGKGKKSCHRHTSYQIQQLEAFFKACPHPDENQRRQMGRDLGLEAKQIKFWFQNKRTQTKAQSEKADNNSLRTENERYKFENLTMKEALKNLYCPNCGGPPFGEEESQLALQKLKMENVQLKQQYEKISSLLPDFLGKPLGQIQSSRWSTDFPPHQGILGGPCLGLDAGDSTNSTVPYQSNRGHSTEKSVMIDTVMNAMDELIRLTRVNEPLWMKSSVDGRYVLHPDSYYKLFPSPCHFKSSATQMESSKDSALVAMDPIELLNMLVDPDRWMALFPTIVTKARTVEVLDTRKLGYLTGSLQLMYEQMHILSPLVGPREFYFLRYCGMVEPGLWVMVDVSHDWCGKDPHAPLHSWKLPSGCLIQDKGNGCSQVTWVEHVELDERYQIHRLYRDLVSGCSAFGAQRWVSTLLRISERLAYAAGACPPSNELRGSAINKQEGRRSIMDLSQRMVKDFCVMLSMSSKLEYPHISELSNSIQVSVRQSGGEHGQPTGTIVSAASSIWLPLSCQALFDFFRDEKTRPQWDVLDNGSIQVASISCGTHPGNCISITQPIVCNGSNLLMLQENCTDPSGSLVVFAPVDYPSIESAMDGADSTQISVLPSGFVISPDGRPDKGKGLVGALTSGGGSLLTVAFQILVSNPSQSEQVKLDSLSTVHTLVSSTVQKVKTYFGYPDVDLAY